MDKPKTVSEITKEIREIVESNFTFVYIIGEISNFKLHTASGHLYFALKDEKSQINANMWSTRTRDLTFVPENGIKVLVKGRITVYETRGTYQIDVFEMIPFGIGNLQMQFEQLKQKLFNEGVFNEIHKKQLPDFPERVAVITSESGAALQDFIKVTKKRYPLVKLYLFQALMQGEGSGQSICKAIRSANRSKIKPEIIVITRGGGSLEDLWSFNEEKVVREIFNSKIPVVTAIGHEIDYTLSDFAADLSAATPSAAAENIFPDKTELLRIIEKRGTDLVDEIKIKFDNINIRLNNISNNYYFKRPADRINENKMRLDEINKRLEEGIKEKLNNLKRYIDLSEKLILNSGPEQTLKRGYSITIRNEKIISKKNLLKKDDELKIRFYDGEAGAKVT